MIEKLEVTHWFMICDPVYSFDVLTTDLEVVPLTLVRGTNKG